ncbi:MAG: hypothetical protein AABX11_02830 [Nanoarchaeota archaeon]
MTLEISDSEFVKLYAEKLLLDKSLFEQQRILIESQLKATNEIFRKLFGDNFEENARKYLRATNRI